MDTLHLQTEISELVKGIKEEDKLLELKAYAEDLKNGPWWVHDKAFLKELDDIEKEHDKNPEKFTDAFEFLAELKKSAPVKNAS